MDAATFYNNESYTCIRYFFKITHKRLNLIEENKIE